MRVYSAAGLRTIGIANSSKISTDFRLSWFTPSWSLVERSKKGLISHEEYADEYLRTLNDIPEDILVRIVQALLSCPTILLCFEGPGKFCHRHLLGRWLMDKFPSIEVKEYEEGCREELP